MAILDCTLEELVFAEKPKTKRFIDIEGQRCGRLKIVGYAGFINSKTSWYCLCDCGNIVQVKTGSINNQNTRSCGCLFRDRVKKRFTKHGKAASKEYRAFSSILKRCNSPKDKAFNYYGERGIKCYFANFEEFYAEVGDAPSPKHSIDRIDNERGYEPGNLRWATAKEQGRNTRKVKHHTVDGQTRTRTEWAEEMGVPISLLKDRKKRGWCDDCMIKTPPKGKPKPCADSDCTRNKSRKQLFINSKALSIKDCIACNIHD